MPLAADLEQYIADTQAYQARFVRYHTEFYRRHKFRPCNGAHVFCFNDCWPAITWALVEYDRTPKQAYYALRQSMAPLQIFLDNPEAERVVGHNETLSLCVVNDFPYEVTDGFVRCDIVGPDGEASSTELSCNVPAVGIMDLAPIHWQPEQAGQYIAKLTCSHRGEVLAENSYELFIN